MSNSDIWKGRWKQIRGRIQDTWGAMTGDELDQLAGKRDQLVGAIQEKTGEARESIEESLDRFENEVLQGETS